MEDLTVLDAAAAVEDALAELYLRIAHHCRLNQTGCDFWQALARDEQRHADMIREHRRQKSLLPSLHPPPPAMARDLAMIGEEIDRLGQDVDAATISSDLESACRLEGLLAQVHNGHAAACDPIMAHLLVRLGKEDRAHLEKIRHWAGSQNLSCRPPEKPSGCPG